MEIVERVDRPNFFQLTNTWILCAILLVFASLYGFSFERGKENTMVGSDTQGVDAGESHEAIVVKAQNIAVYLLSAACVLPFIKQVWRQLRRNLLIFSVVGWAALSIVWSDNASTSGINSIRLLINLALVVYLFERYSANELKKLILLVGSVASVGSLFLVVAFPQYGLQSRGTYALGAWQGIFGQKNICGLEMLVLLLPAFFVRTGSISTRALRALYIATVLVIIVMTRSAGAWILTTLCLVFVAMLKMTRRMPWKETALIGIFSCCTALAIAVIGFANYDSVMFALGKDPTMTGRTVLWDGLLHSILKRPVLGYGYMAFWQGLQGESGYLSLKLHWPGLSGAESGILELWLELGIVGVLLYMAIFLCSVKDAFYCLNRGATPAAMWYISILFYVLAVNIEGGLLLAPSNLACMVPFVAYVGLRREAQYLRRRQLV